MPGAHGLCFNVEMPARTNRFQRLIAIIQSHLEPGALVEESKFLPDRHTGTPREVDVVVSGRVARQAIVISLECRDHERSQSVKWVEEMQSKHSRLPTNLLVLVSSTPFSTEALSIAGFYGIKCLTWSDVDSDAPDRLFPTATSLSGKAWTLEIDRVEVHVGQDGSLAPEWFKASPGTVVYLDGSPETSTIVSNVVQIMLRSPTFIHQVGIKALPEHSFLTLEWRTPELEGRALTVRKEEPEIYRAIAMLRIVARCEITVDEFQLRHGIIDTTRVAWGTGTLLNSPTLFLATSDGSNLPKITLQIGDLQVVPAVKTIGATQAE